MLLQMKDICKDYLQGKETVQVLKNISIDIKEGDYVAIMGPSGSGKTTLMNLMGYLDTPTSGTYLLDGEELSHAGDNRLAEVRNNRIGFVFQSFHLLPKLTAVENVALPLLYRGMGKAERTQKAEEALKLVGLSDRLQFKPNQLSGGQCQRVAIARAFVGKPKLLLADEPTGALDSASGRQVMEIFENLNKMGITIVMITHEQAVADCAKKIYHIFDGEILETKGGRAEDYE